MAVAEIPNYSMVVGVSSCCSVDFRGRRGEQYVEGWMEMSSCGIQERYRAVARYLEREEGREG
jgi:hypothetical protein